MTVLTWRLVGFCFATTIAAHTLAGGAELQDGQLYQGQPAPKAYEIHDGEVLDIEAGLIWQRCSVGQVWASGKGCEGQVETFSFDNAQRKAYGQWRLPTNFELAKLIDHGRAFQDLPPTIDVGAFPNMDPKNLWYWTSVSDGPFVAWYASFLDGRFSLDDRKFAYAVRLVRDRQ